MSAFLGPIHYWLYNKIQFQDKFTAALLTAALSEEKRILFLEQLDSDWGEVERGPLEAVIDEGNIHGWLQAQISVSETRLAHVAAKLLAEGSAAWNGLEEAAYQFGREYPMTGAADAEEIFGELNNRLLDGMPCDQVNEILEQGPKRISWKQRADLHQSYWEDAGCGASDYKRLRGAWISGMLEGSGFCYSQENGRFSIQEV